MRNGENSYHTRRIQQTWLIDYDLRRCGNDVWWRRLLGMISRALKPMDIAVEIVDHKGGWGPETKWAVGCKRWGINVSYSQHIGNPVRCKTANPPDAQGHRGGIDVSILSKSSQPHPTLEKESTYRPSWIVSVTSRRRLELQRETRLLRYRELHGSTAKSWETFNCKPASCL